MNIGIDIRCLLTPHRTGVGEFTFELLSELFKTDRENQYYLFCNSSSLPKEFFPKYDNVHVLWTRFPNKLFNFVEAIIKFPKIDRMIARHFGISELDIFFSPHLNFTSLSKNTKHVILIHDLTFELFPEFLTIKQIFWHKLTRPKKQIMKARLVLTPSENTKGDVITYYGTDSEKVKILYPGISPKFLGPPPQTPLPKKPYILFLGTIEPRKNILALIKAFEAVYPKLKEEHELVIAGAPGWKNGDVKKEVAISKYRDKIRVINFVPDEVKSGLYRNAKLFVYPSFYEGFGFPVLEAIFSGIPVITSNRSSLFEVSGNAAYYVDPNRPEQIASGIYEILTDTSVRESMLGKGKTNIQKFIWQNSVNNLTDLFKSI